MQKHAIHPPKNKLHYYNDTDRILLHQNPVSPQTDADFWWAPRALHQATKNLLQSQFFNNSLHQRRGRRQGRAWGLLFPAHCPVGRAQEFCPLYSLVLHHVHDHPVEGIHVLPNEVLEHDERFHQEILKEETTAGENWTKELQGMVVIVNE